MDVGVDVILSVSGLVLAAVIAAAAGERLGAPLLLVFLAVGVAAGPEGLSLVVWEDSRAAFAAASAALAVILLDGGLRTRPETLKAGIAPGLSMATLGVFATAGLVALAAKAAFNLGWAEALLIGAVVSSTDAAAVFSLLGGKGTRVRPRVAATLETESGLNDPAAVFLTLTLAGALASGAPTQPHVLAVSLLWQALGGLLAGGLAGWALAYAKPRLKLAPGLRPIFTLAGGVFAFGAAQTFGASGFLAVYVCGLVEARGARGVVEADARALDGFAWLAQLTLFLTLGLLAAPSHIMAILIPAGAVAATLILVARPVATFLVLAPFRFSVPERLFASWVGLRGATPVFLGLTPVVLGTPNANLYFSVAFVIVGASLVVQGWTTPLAARVLGVAETDDGTPAGAGGTTRFAAPSPLRLIAVGLALMSVCAAMVWTARIAAPVSLPAFTPTTVAQLSADLAKAGPTEATRLPRDWLTITDAQRRQRLFIETLAPLAALENDRILAERAEVQAFLRAEAAGRRLSLREQARRDVLARTYGGAYDDLPGLLERMDAAPVSLIIAQAALTTGWGQSTAALEANALFGRGPSGATQDGETTNAAPAFPTLRASIADYLRVLNTHGGFTEFRDARARLRAEGAALTGSALAAHIAPFAADGEQFAQAVERIIVAEDLERFDAPN